MMKSTTINGFNIEDEHEGECLIKEQRVTRAHSSAAQ